MDTSVKMSFQLFVIGILICLSTVFPSSNAVKHPKQKPSNHLMLEYNWPDPNPNIDHFPHESSCHYYYLVLSEDDIELKRCPDGELFDYLLHKCVSKESVRCWSRSFGKIKHRHIPSKHRDQLRCPYEWGKFPVLYDCKKYYSCINNRAKLKKCAPFEKFDKIQRKCVAEIDAVCADSTDHVEPGYKCPRNWGYFLFKKDCSKYYECLRQTPSLRTCMPGDLFDVRQGKCLPKHQVKCGSRPNPYVTKRPDISSESPMIKLTSEASLTNLVDAAQNTIENISSSSEIPKLFSKIWPEEKLEKSTVTEIRLTASVIPDSSDVSPKEKNSTGFSSANPDLSLTSPVVLGDLKSIDISSGTPKKLTQTPVVLPKSEKSVDDSRDTLNEESASQNPVNSPKEENLIKDPSSISEKSLSKGVGVSPNAPKSTDIYSDTPAEKIILQNPVISPKPKNPTKHSNSTAEKLESGSTLNGKSTVGLLKKNEEVETSPFPIVDQSTMIKSVKSEFIEISDLQKTFDETTRVQRIDISPQPSSVGFAHHEHITDVVPQRTFIEKKPIPVMKVDEVSPPPSLAGSEQFKEIVTKISENFSGKESTEKSNETCARDDLTCIKEKDGTIVRCPAINGLFPYQKDEKKFIMCENNNIRIPECPKDLLFDHVQKKCLWKVILF